MNSSDSQQYSGLQNRGSIDCERLLRDLETGHEIARHGLSQGQGVVIRNTDPYRDKQPRIEKLEQDIQQPLGSVAGERLCTLLKRSHPRIDKDQ